MIYLDHAASTYPYVEVIHLFRDSLGEAFANPSAAHRLGLQEELKIKDAKNRLAKVLHCEAGELILCSGATEAANMAIKGYLNANRHSGKKVLVTAAEHAAVYQTAKFICAKLQLEFCEIALNRDGTVDLADLAQQLNQECAFVCVMAVNNETGAVNDLHAVTRLLHEKAPQAKLCVDYVQALCKAELNLRQAAVDFGIFSGHKVHAPKGVGMLYVKKGTRIEPLLHGGGHQGGLRSGTENALFAEALAIAVEHGTRNLRADREKVAKLRRIFMEHLDESLYCVNSATDASPWILNLSFEGVKGETLLHALADQETYISQASSCHSKAPHSHVLKAMKLSVSRMESAVRVSFDASQSEADIEKASGQINELVRALRRISKR